jgi:hypothetical protein
MTGSTGSRRIRVRNRLSGVRTHWRVRTSEIRADGCRTLPRPGDLQLYEHLGFVRDRIIEMTTTTSAQLSVSGT